MDVREALYTTRAMRRVKPDAIPEDVQKRILDAAIRAPSGGNSQGWRFMLVDDAGVKAKLGPLYRECLGTLFDTLYKPQLDSAQLVRSQDMRGLVRELVGLPGLPGADIGPDEVVLSETFYRTYRRGRWKSMSLRRRGTTVLYDIEQDPAETRDVASLHPEVVAEHRERVEQLTQQLGTTEAADSVLSADDEERLRALGYLE